MSTFDCSVMAGFQFQLGRWLADALITAGVLAVLATFVFAFVLWGNHKDKKRLAKAEAERKAKAKHFAQTYQEPSKDSQRT